MRSLIAVILGFIILCGAISLIPGNWHPYLNEKNPGESTFANFTISDRERQDGMLVSIALSGGGSRAANFSAAVLLELKKLGVLKHIDFLSSVSGGSLTAAYFALDGYQYSTLTGWDKISFNENELKDRLGRNFQLRYLGRWFLPWNAIRYWLTNFNRTDIMVDILDTNLFHGATFADLNPERPKLLVNASEMGDLQRFVFSDHTFQSIGSDLSTYQVSVAATASLAVPGIFHTVMLQNHREQQATYLHLADGAAMDYLGIQTLLNVLQNSREQDTYTFPKGCVLISIDAFPNFYNWDLHQEETREFPEDYIIDRNGSRALEFLLLPNRERTLERVGIPLSKIDTVAIGTFPVVENARQRCRFWHIALRHISVTDKLGKALSRIPTELNIKEAQQEVLFAAARRLVQHGWDKGPSSWFQNEEDSK